MSVVTTAAPSNTDHVMRGCVGIVWLPPSFILHTGKTTPASNTRQTLRTLAHHQTQHLGTRVTHAQLQTNATRCQPGPQLSHDSVALFSPLAKCCLESADSSGATSVAAQRLLCQRAAHWQLQPPPHNSTRAALCVSLSRHTSQHALYLSTTTTTRVTTPPRQQVSQAHAGM
jgi:hypothetical protein